MEGCRPFLIVVIGEPYEGGRRIYLPFKEFLLGRSWGIIRPDVSFTSQYISKRHAIINYENNQFTITDLGSKHGTQINNHDLVPYRSVLLKHGDQIGLAKGTAMLSFNSAEESESGDTVDFTGSVFEDPIGGAEPASPIFVNIQRREVLLDGKPVPLFGKEIELILLLYQNRNKAVSYDEIRKRVWPERPASLTTGVPDVGNDEINALVYRVRKRLDKYGRQIVTIPRYGYMLDFYR
ncbi:MAG: FHA domain-containing protein [Bacillota bacterium]